MNFVQNKQTNKQTNKCCLCKSISPFTMGLYRSLHDYIIHEALIATSHDCAYH